MKVFELLEAAEYKPHLYTGVCNHCGHSTTASTDHKGVPIACKWGKCNGEVKLVRDPQIKEAAKAPKKYKLIMDRNGGLRVGTSTRKPIEHIGTVPELIEYAKYTLEKGKSWEHEKGNKKINLNPKTIDQLISNLNNAENNAAANGYSNVSYSYEEVKDSDIQEALDPQGRVKGSWKISNMNGVEKMFKSEESPDAQAWMKNRGGADQKWNGTAWEVKELKNKVPDDVKAARDDERHGKRQERERVGRHLKSSDYQKIYNQWNECVGNSFPDGDPMDSLGRWFKKTYPEIYEGNTMDVIDRALKICGHGYERKGHYVSLSTMWEEHALDGLHDLNTLVEKGKSLKDALKDTDSGLADNFFHLEKDKLVMADNPWGKVDRKKYMADFKKRYPKIEFKSI